MDDDEKQFNFILKDMENLWSLVYHMDNYFHSLFKFYITLVSAILAFFIAYVGYIKSTKVGVVPLVPRPHRE